MSFLVARPLLGTPRVIKLWVGAFGFTTPPTLSFALNDQPITPTATEPLAPIRDDTWWRDEPLNYQGIFTFPTYGANVEHRFSLRTDRGEPPFSLRVKSLPEAVPVLPGKFRIMLMSCYCADTDAVDVGRFVKHLPVRPDMALFAGDQVYLDQPVFEQMPTTEAALRRNISAKYQRNWLSDHNNMKGLQNALAFAPAICLPDDHEFWNNYPWPQFWKRGTGDNPTATGLNIWDDAARDLFQDYQLGGSPANQQPWTALDIDPLCMLFLDTRSHRQKDFLSPTGLMPDTARQAMRDWERKLLDHKAAGNPRTGVLASGQTLLCNPAAHPKIKDAEYANYERQFAEMMAILDNLTGQGIQVLFLTGDVHWNRVAQAANRQTRRLSLTEVICSPSSLCAVPILDQLGNLVNQVRGIWSAKDPWNLHPEPEKPPDFIGAQKQFVRSDKFFGWKGNHVAMLELSRAGTGVDMKVNYYPISSSGVSPVSTCYYTLMNG